MSAKKYSNPFDLTKKGFFMYNWFFYNTLSPGKSIFAHDIPLILNRIACECKIIRLGIVKKWMKKNLLDTVKSWKFSAIGTLTKNMFKAVFRKHYSWSSLYHVYIQYWSCLQSNLFESGTSAEGVSILPLEIEIPEGGTGWTIFTSSE